MSRLLDIRPVTLLTILSLCISVNSFADVNQGVKRGNFADRVAGTYVIAAYLGDAIPGESVPVQALATLNADGGVIATDTDDFGFEILQEFHSPKHGGWYRSGKNEITITIYEFGLADLGLGDPAPTVIYKLTFVAEFSDDSFNGGVGVVAYTVRLLPLVDSSADPLDLDSGTLAAPPGTGSVEFRRVAM